MTWKAWREEPPPHDVWIEATYSSGQPSPGVQHNVQRINSSSLRPDHNVANMYWRLLPDARKEAGRVATKEDIEAEALAAEGIVKVGRWKTTDGEVHDTVEAARTHMKHVLLAEAFDDLFDATHDNGYAPKPRPLAVEILREPHRSRFLRLLGGAS